MNLVFFDSGCSVCRKSVAFLVRIDHKKQLLFAPLDGKTAKEKLETHLLEQNSLILMEGKRVWLRGRAVFRIFWLLGGIWKVLGALYILPFIDIFYRLFAHHRHLFSPAEDLSELMQKEKDRFIP